MRGHLSQVIYDHILRNGVIGNTITKNILPSSEPIHENVYFLT